ncbi:glycine betaine ABC transporter substrate-binding protein [Chloroflexota bacterium]
MRKIIVTVLAAVLVLTLLFTGCAKEAGIKEITVGNKNFTEQYIVGQLMKQLLEANGFKVNLIADLSTMALREGMEAGDIDICADYTGTAWMVHLEHEYEPGIDNNKLYEMVKEEEKANGFIWLDPMWNNNTYAMACWKEFADKHNITTLSDLAALYRENDGKVDTFVNFEYSTRPDGLPALEKYYNFEVAESTLKTGAPGASLLALEERQTEVIMVFGTDPAIAKHGWHVFQDDKAFFPPYDLTPYVRQEVVDKYPEIEGILNKLVATFPGGGQAATPAIVSQGQSAWQQLNARVDIDKLEPDEVAREYLLKHGLVK